MTRFVRQQQPSLLSCGQTCVAMLLGIPAMNVIARVHDRRPTTIHHLAPILREHGWYCASKHLVRGAPAVSTGVALCRVRWGTDSKDTRAHWVLWTGSEFLDPLARKPIFLTAENGRVLSYMPVERVAP